MADRDLAFDRTAGAHPARESRLPCSRRLAAVFGALLAVRMFLPAPSSASPVAPAGADPAGLAPERGVDLYFALGGPASSLGGDARRGRWALGAEIAWLFPGALRPEIHARRIFSLGALALTPHASMGVSFPARPLAGAPAATSLEPGVGLLASYSLGEVAFFVDGGTLGLLDPNYKAHTRLVGTGAVGARWRATHQVALSAWMGTLASVGRFAPAGGLCLTTSLGAGRP